MAEQQLRDKKEELKSLLDNAKERVGFGNYLYWLGEKIQKIFRCKKQPSQLKSVLIFYFFITIICIIIVFLLDKPFVSILLSTVGPILILNIAVISIIILVLQEHYRTIFKSLKGFFIDAIDNLDDLVDFQQWLSPLLNYRRQLVFSIILGIACGSYPPIIVGELLGFKSYGFAFYLAAVSFLGSLGLYTSYMFMFLPLRVRNYRYNIYSADPGKATFTKQLSSVLNSPIFLYAILGLVMILITFLFRIGTDIRVQGILILLVWLPITFMFILNQIGLSNIISVAKTQKLAEIESEIKTIEATNKIADQETLEAINRMMDYHDRIQRTHNSSLNLRSILNFLNSLLIPALGFIIDTLLKLFARNP